MNKKLNNEHLAPRIQDVTFRDWFENNEIEFLGSIPDSKARSSLSE